jgi:FkbM family methyltransferase
MYHSLSELNKRYLILSRVKHIILKVFSFIFALNSSNKWSVALSLKLSGLSTEIIEGKKRFVFTTTNPILLWRVKTFYSKEPETVEWIKSFKSDDIFFDIGANVGIYAIYAGERCKKVYAFEPEASNFGLLNRNIQLNELGDKIRAYCMAISDENTFNTIRLSSLTPGSAFHSFAVNKDYNGKEFNPVFEQGCISYTLDSIVYDIGFEVPNHIKIDVDGLESKILNGSMRLLNEKKLKSILVELNTKLPQDLKIIKLLKECGFGACKTGEYHMVEKEKGSVVNMIFERS